LNNYAQLIQFDWSFLMILVNMFILYLIMKKFFFEKIRNFMLKRQEGITNALLNADKVNIEAENLKKNYEEKIEALEEEGKEIIKNYKIKADERAREIILEAQKKADELKKKAEEDIDRQKRIAVEEMKDEIAALAILAAEKIIEKQLNAAEHQAMINKILKDTGKLKWQN